MENVSPAFVVTFAVRAPHMSRNGVVAFDSPNSTPTIVAAGMFVTDTAAFDAIDPADAAANVTVGAPVPAVYPPDVANSVPAAVSDPFAVIRRQWIGVVTDGPPDPVNMSVRTWLATVWLIPDMGHSSHVLEGQPAAAQQAI